MTVVTLPIDAAAQMPVQRTGFIDYQLWNNAYSKFIFKYVNEETHDWSSPTT